jgi:glycosyltransferase involved in cell wall biosynthesis
VAQLGKNTNGEGSASTRARQGNRARSGANSRGRVATSLDRPLVSIVTPTLERLAYLERTLRSVRAQTYANVEHIVVDGGSTDGTLELLERYAGTYNLRWISEPDRGMYDAINKGLRMATGEILAYLNSDDLYFPWTVEVAVEALAGHLEADVVYGDAIRMDEIHQWVVPVFMPPFSTMATAAYGSLLQPVVLLRRHVFDALGGFDDSFAYVADMDFWLRAAPRFKFLRIAEFLALEQRHIGMLSETRRSEMDAEDVRMRMAYRRGISAGEIGRVAAYIRWHWWSGRSWFGFTRAVRSGKSGWGRTIEACQPAIGVWAAVLGLLPSKGSRLRRTVRWGSDPLSIASAADIDSER